MLSKEPLIFSWKTCLPLMGHEWGWWAQRQPWAVFYFLLLCCVDAARASTLTDTSIHTETPMYTQHTVYHKYAHACMALQCTYSDTWMYGITQCTHKCYHMARTHTPAFMTSHNMCTPASKTPHTAHIYMCDATLHKYMCMALHTMHMCAYHTAYIYA